MLEYQQVTEKDFNELDDYLERWRNKYQALQMILFCEYSNGQSCDEMFHPVLTDKGICQSLNPLSIGNYMIKTNYTEMFNEVFQASKPRHTGGNLTSSFSINLVLDSHLSGRMMSQLSSIKPIFKNTS